MPRRGSFLVAAPHAAAPENRRRSADERIIIGGGTRRSTNLPTERVSGTTWSRPILIPSDDEKDEMNNKPRKLRDDAQQDHAPTPLRPQEVFPLRSKSEAQLLQAFTSPEKDRPTMPRMAQTDPGVNSLSDRADTTELSPFHSPCGKPRAYVRRGNYENHVRSCTNCQKIIAKDSQSEEIASPPLLDPSLAQSEDASRRQPSLPEPSQEEEPEEVQVSATPAAATVATNDNPLVSLPHVSAIDIHSSLLRKTCEPYMKEKRQACVYLLRSPDLPGLVKVGMAGDIKNRKSNFKSQCGQIMETIDNVDLMHGVERIEALVKLDLSEFNERQKCKRCGRQHKEWFRIDEVRAKTTLQMWVDWLEQKPYQSDGQIKPIWRHLLWQSRAPIPRFKNEDHEARHAHWEKALNAPTSDELDKFALTQPLEQRRREPGEEEGVARVDSPQRGAPYATPVQNNTYHITDNSVNKYKGCRTGSRVNLGAPP